MASPTIRVVDDEETVRHIVGRMLRASGFSLLEATNGREALQLVEQREEPPDLILTDVVMPATEWRGAGSAGARRPAGATGPTDVRLRAGRSAAAGLYPEGLPFVQKPFTLDRLVRTVRSALA